MGKNIKFKFIKTCALKGVSSLWKGVELKLIKGGGSSSKGGSSSAKSRLGLVGIKFVVVAASKRMSKERNETPICHCGQRSVMRTANNMKNRGKHFWGCSKYKNGGEDDGCNFFKWCTNAGSEDSGRYVKSEGKKETLVISEELEMYEGVDLVGLFFMCHNDDFSFNVSENGMIRCNVICKNVI
ncbi:hypothetical protein V8G54_031903 [Vigna mungo]|uniref:GRF-type domain-containing protein n=1 Tax=Vigna mungo TaxID=3915 RepID=A0AAQ3RIB9_VIGMU